MSAGATVAFYAYASGTFSRPSDHFILHFDTVITNAGNGYHPHSGVFIAPRSGYYVFTWSFVHINQGDEVFLRTTKFLTDMGDIYSDFVGRTYFAGWLMA